MVKVEKKRGKDTFAATYGIKDEAAALSYNHKPFKVGFGCGWVLFCLHAQALQQQRCGVYGCWRGGGGVGWLRRG